MSGARTSYTEPPRAGGNGKHEFPPGAVARDLGGLAHDAIELGELQFDLFKIELRQTALGFFGPLVLFAISALALIAALPLLLFFVASALIQWAGWNEGYEPWAYLTAFGVGALIAGGLGLTGWTILKRKLDVFRSSREELARNLAWVKSALRR